MTKLPTLATRLFLALCLSGWLPGTSVLAAPASRPPVAPAPAVVLSAAERAYYTAAFEQHVTATYTQARLLQAGLSVEAFRKAMLGFYNLQQRGLVKAACRTLTVIDFGRSSTQERLWVLDVATGRLIHQSLVAHGKNSGEEYARTFSNQEGSEMSSLGFYITANPYQGKHGLSLRLQGVDAGYNTNALSRAVVVHGADYVSREFVRAHGRLGRSQGCPALPVAQAPAIIRTLKNGTVVFINAPAQVSYQSGWLDLDQALLAFAQSRGIVLRPS